MSHQDSQGLGGLSKPAVQALQEWGDSISKHFKKLNSTPAFVSESISIPENTESITLHFHVESDKTFPMDFLRWVTDLPQDVQDYILESPSTNVDYQDHLGSITFNNPKKQLDYFDILPDKYAAPSGYYVISTNNNYLQQENEELILRDEMENFESLVLLLDDDTHEYFSTYNRRRVTTNSGDDIIIFTNLTQGVEVFNSEEEALDTLANFMPSTIDNLSLRVEELSIGEYEMITEHETMKGSN